MRVLYTIGHSTRSIEEFLEILSTFEIHQLVDVRTLPGSKKHPQFDRENLEAVLTEKQIVYRWMKNLGGLRKVAKNSPNDGWRNNSFRGYADYMQSNEFQIAIDELAQSASQNKTAIMCAEAVPWRCHRSLIGDAFLCREWKVCDIFSKTSVKPHTLTSFAKVQGDGKLIYPK